MGSMDLFSLSLLLKVLWADFPEWCYKNKSWLINSKPIARKYFPGILTGNAQWSMKRSNLLCAHWWANLLQSDTFGYGSDRYYKMTIFTLTPSCYAESEDENIRTANFVIFPKYAFQTFKHIGNLWMRRYENTWGVCLQIAASSLKLALIKWKCMPVCYSSYAARVVTTRRVILPKLNASLSFAFRGLWIRLYLFLKPLCARTQECWWLCIIYLRGKLDIKC